MANKRYKWYVTKSVYVGITTFFSWQKKKEQEITRSRMWTRIFRVKWCTIGMHNGTNCPWNKFLRRRFIRKESSSTVTINLLAQNFWSNYFFYIRYHPGGSTKHLPRSKAKRPKEESSPSGATTPKKGETRLVGKIRTDLLACPLTPTPQPIFLPPALVKQKCVDLEKWHE